MKTERPKCMQAKSAWSDSHPSCSCSLGLYNKCNWKLYNIPSMFMFMFMTIILSQVHSLNLVQRKITPYNVQIAIPYGTYLSYPPQYFNSTDRTPVSVYSSQYCRFSAQQCGRSVAARWTRLSRQFPKVQPEAGPVWATVTILLSIRCRVSPLRPSWHYSSTSGAWFRCQVCYTVTAVMLLTVERPSVTPNHDDKSAAHYCAIGKGLLVTWSGRRGTLVAWRHVMQCYFRDSSLA
jgi:hypothetical protein